MNALLQKQIEEVSSEAITAMSVATRGVEVVMPETGIVQLLSGDPIRVYLGIDPTSPNLHIGHLVVLRKLRALQILGHHVILLIGTFTGMIGDPTDKSAARVRLTPEQIEANVATYLQQAAMVLDLSEDAPNPVEVVYNHQWLEKLTFMDVVELASNFTVNELITRITYRQRLEANQPLFLHEFMYSLMQGYDSVALGVQLEIGGKDQLTNMLAGRTLVKVMQNAEKMVMGLKLIEDPSGKKMGKTSGNVVNITELPEVVYEAMMTWPDSAIALGLELLTSVPMNIVEQVESELTDIASGDSSANPMELKEALAWRVVFELHGLEAAKFARSVFDQVKRHKMLPPRIAEFQVLAGETVIGALVTSGLCASEEEAQSKLSQQAVVVSGKRVSKNIQLPVGLSTIQIGKNPIKNIRRVIVS